MAYSKVLFVSYSVPTFFPSDPSAGGVAPQNGAPRVQIDNADLQARTQRFLNVLFLARATLAKATPDATDSSILKVFMAPEFYFRMATDADLQANAFDQTRSFWGSYPRGSRQVLMNALYAAIGTNPDFKDWTVVAGTICSWAHEEDPALPFLMNTALLLRGPRAAPDGSEPYTFMEKHYFSQIDLDLNNPENDLWNVRRSLTSVFSQRRNPDFVLDNLVRWDGMLNGLEICLDHAYDVVRTGLNLLHRVWDKVTYADLQLVTSCGMSIRNTAIGVRPGGLVLLTDGQNPLPQMVRYTPPVNLYDVDTTVILPNQHYVLPNDADHCVGNVAGFQGFFTFASQDMNLPGGA